MKKSTVYVLLAAIAGFQIITTAIWLAIDTSYLKLDAWRNFRYSLEVYSFLKQAAHLHLPLSWIEPQSWHGILLGFITAPFIFIVGPGQDAAILIANALFLALLIAATYGIGKKIAGPPAGVLAAFMASVYPAIFNNLRVYMLDLPLTAVAAASLYFLLSSDGLKDKKNCVLFWASCFFGLLIKFNFIAFLLCPFIFVLAGSARRERGRSAVLLRASISLAAITFILFAAFYGTKTKEILQRVYDTSVIGAFTVYHLDAPAFILWKSAGILRFIESWITQGMSFFMFAVFLLGLVFFKKNRELAHKTEAYLFIVPPLLGLIFLLSLYPEHMLRYAIPLLPLFAVISAAGVLGIRSAFFRRSVVALIVLLGLTQFFAVSFGTVLLPQKIAFNLPGGLINHELVLFQQKMDVFPFGADKSSHPATADWKSGETLATITGSNPEGKRIKVLSLSYVPELFEAMDYRILLNRSLIDLMPVTVLFQDKSYEKRPIKLAEACLSADYVLLTNDYARWEYMREIYPGIARGIGAARKAFDVNMRSFALIKNIPLPDGTILSIYRRNRDSRPDSSCTIRAGDLTLLFDSGRIRIFYNDQEITKGLGLYASLFSLQHWRDSMEATWSARKTGDSSITAEGRWMFIPVVQKWRIEFRDGNVFWEVSTSVEDPIKIEAVDFKLMLSDAYAKWASPDIAEGNFPGTFNTDSWQRLWAGDGASYAAVKAIAGPGGTLPAVKFYRVPPGWSLSVDNSDTLFCGRVIGSWKKNTPGNNLYLPSRSETFSAEISVRP
jgi:4-amino-4-deoxy-L-arabinose transferase-like glycosyltransferase